MIQHADKPEGGNCDEAQRIVQGVSKRSLQPLGSGFYTTEQYMHFTRTWDCKSLLF